MYYYFYMNINKWLKQNTNDLTGKTIAITGSTGDLANKLVFVLAKLNANLILLNRNKEKTEKQIKELFTLYPNIQIEFIECDLSNFETVKQTAEILKQKSIDFLYLSSGIYNVARFKTELGYDNIFQTNFVSHYYLAKELLPTLKQNNGKIIAVGSIAYNYSKINEHDIDLSNIKKASKVYGNSKRFLTFALHKLCKKENIPLSIVHPGVTLTNITNHYPKVINWLVKAGIKLLFPTNKKAVLSLIKGVFEITQYNYWIGPSIFNIWGTPKNKKLKIKNIESEKIYIIAEKIYDNIKK